MDNDHTVLLIIVGAGARFDSDWRRPDGPTYTFARSHDLGIHWRPPLAKDLFDEDRFGGYVARYPPSQSLMDRLRKAAPAVEQELERIRDLSKDQEHLPRQLLAVRYYLRELIEETVRQWNGAKPDKMTAAGRSTPPRCHYPNLCSACVWRIVAGCLKLPPKLVRFGGQQCASVRSVCIQNRARLGGGGGN